MEKNGKSILINGIVGSSLRFAGSVVSLLSSASPILGIIGIYLGAVGGIYTFVMSIILLCKIKKYFSEEQSFAKITGWLPLIFSILSFVFTIISLITFAWLLILIWGLISLVISIVTMSLWIKLQSKTKNKMNN